MLHKIFLFLIAELGGKALTSTVGSGLTATSKSKDFDPKKAGVRQPALFLPGVYCSLIWFRFPMFVLRISGRPGLLHHVYPFTIGANPGGAIGDSPSVFSKTLRAYLKATGTTPAKRLRLFATMAGIPFFPPSSTLFFFDSHDFLNV